MVSRREPVLGYMFLNEAPDIHPTVCCGILNKCWRRCLVLRLWMGSATLARVQGAKAALLGGFR
jgi:hypothetical protein